MKEKNKTFPNRLAMLRRANGFGQEQVSKALGLNNPASLSGWENGGSMPHGTNLIKLCVFYNKSIYEIYPEHYNFLDAKLLPLRKGIKNDYKK